MSWQGAPVGAYRPQDLHVAARIQHACEPPDVPMIGPRGQLIFRDRTSRLSERETLLAGVLVYYFEAEITDAQLLDRVWPEGATRRTLRHRLRRLDRRLARVGLRIVEVGDRSHALHAVERLGVDGAAGRSADEQYSHVGPVHQPVRDRSEH